MQKSSKSFHAFDFPFLAYIVFFLIFHTLHLNFYVVNVQIIQNQIPTVYSIMSDSTQIIWTFVS